MSRRFLVPFLLLVATAGCTDLQVSPSGDAGQRDGASADAASRVDGAVTDSRVFDSGALDSGEPVQCVLRRFFRDVDGDGAGDAEAMVDACAEPAGYVAVAGDCNDDCFACQVGGSELCDGLDNDCDGMVDENSDVSCGSVVGACEQGWQRCESGRLTACEGAVSSTAEVCEGSVDENCDGTVDEGCACAAGAKPVACGSSLGSCELGTQSCEAGAWAQCAGAVLASAEVCDGLDNDCDGSVDEELGVRSCGSSVGTCTAGTESCLGGSWQCQSAAEPAPEVCDGLDNNCDGQTDEGLLNACGTCGAAPAEVCEGAVDENCDGAVDEGCNCTDGDSRPCGNNTGPCRAEQNCTAGQWGDCMVSIGPAADNSCDGRDNDCDGKVDETPAVKEDCGECGYACAGTLQCNPDGTCQQKVSKLRLGPLASCAMMQPQGDGSSEVYCWGANASETLLPGGASVLTVPTRLGAVSSTYQAVGVGVQYLVYSDNSGVTLRSSGGDSLVDGNTADRVAVGILAACYGSSATGASCAASGSAVAINRAAGTPVAPMGDVIAPGRAVVVVSDGSIWQLSLTSSDEFATKVKSTSGSDLSGVVQVEGSAIDTSGVSRYCVRRDNGTVACWGSLAEGELGQPEGVLVSAVEVPGISDAVDIAVGAGSSCAVKRGGTVLCWGSSRSSSTNAYDIYPAQPTTTLLKQPTGIGLTDVIDLEGGSYHFCALRRSGQVTCWGANDYGQLGNGQTSKLATGFEKVVNMP